MNLNRLLAGGAQKNLSDEQITEEPSKGCCASEPERPHFQENLAVNTGNSYNFSGVICDVT